MAGNITEKELTQEMKYIASLILHKINNNEHPAEILKYAMNKFSVLATKEIEEGEDIQKTFAQVFEGFELEDVFVVVDNVVWGWALGEGRFYNSKLGGEEHIACSMALSLIYYDRTLRIDGSKRLFVKQEFLMTLIEHGGGHE